MNEITTSSDSPVSSSSTFHMLTNPASLQAMVAFADVMAKAVVTVPQHLRGKPADCLAIVMQAAQWGMNPFAVAQKTHLVNGTLGYEAQLVLAVLQASGAVQGAPIYEYRGSGESLECSVSMLLRGESEPRSGPWLRMSQVATRNSPLWKTNPAQQLGYLQVKNWARQYSPGPILGVYTPDELEVPPVVERDMGQAEQVAEGPRRRSEKAAPATVVDADTGEVTQGPRDDAPSRHASEPKQAAPASTAAGSLTGGQAAYLRNKLKQAGVDEAQVCGRFEVESIEMLSADDFASLKAELLAAA